MASSDIEMGTGDEISYSRIHVEGRSRTTEEWKSTFVAKVEQSKSPMPNKCCIFKVPEVLQRQKKIAYQPHSIQGQKYSNKISHKVSGSNSISLLI